MSIMTYGTLPSPASFQAAWQREELTTYDIETHQSDWTMLADAVNQGIDSHLESVACEQFEGQHGKGGLRILDAQSLRTLIRRLIATDDEDVLDFASGILQTLDMEWI